MKYTTFVNKLIRLRKRNHKNKQAINIDLYKWMLKEDALVAGYEKIKSNKGATTMGVDKISLDGFNTERLFQLRNALCDESWKPRPALRVNRPKPGKKEMRPLGIQGPEEKIVQATMLMILEAIYEPTFLETSFGFRPNKGVHDALNVIDENYDGMAYAIEGDIKGMYDNVNHHTLIMLLEKRIRDARFIRLVWKLLRAGYMEKDKPLIKSVIGTPQGSIVSPILSNIYLHELDCFMATKVQNLPKWKKKQTPKFKELFNTMARIKYALKKPNLPSSQRQFYLRELRSVKLQSLQIRRHLNPNPRILYTRYADDFIVGIAGCKEFSLGLKDEIKNFLTKYHLTLNEDKTKLTQLRKNYAVFLGHRIQIDTSTKFAYVRRKGQTHHLKRVTGSFILLTAPIDAIVQRLSLKGFCDRKGFPTHKKLWTTQEDHQIIDNFNATIRGIFGFYSGVHKPNQLSRIWYILKFSCAKTLAAKHRNSLRKIFKKHGPQLKVIYGNSGEKSIILYQPNLKSPNRHWQVGHQWEDPYRIIAARVAKTKIYEKCCICGASNIEMHHIKHIKKSRSGFTLRIMGLLNRKQIPVCRPCHVNIHKGKYDGIYLRDFINPEAARR